MSIRQFERMGRDELVRFYLLVASRELNHNEMDYLWYWVVDHSSTPLDNIFAWLEVQPIRHLSLEDRVEILKEMGNLKEMSNLD